MIADLKTLYGYPRGNSCSLWLGQQDAVGQAQVYRQQYGFNAIYLIPVNPYDPGDDLDPRSSHVIPALIKKGVDAVE